MKNWKIWLDNFVFILILGVILFIREIHDITGISIRVLVFFAGLMIVLSALKIFSNTIIFIKKIFEK